MHKHRFQNIVDAKLEREVNRQLTPATSKVLIHLLRYYYNRKTLVAYPKQTRIARELNISVRTVERAIKQLKERGTILVTKTKKYTKKGPFMQNIYSFPTIGIDKNNVLTVIRPKVGKELRKNTVVESQRLPSCSSPTKQKTHVCNATTTCSSTKEPDLSRFDMLMRMMISSLLRGDLDPHNCYKSSALLRHAREHNCNVYVAGKELGMYKSDIELDCAIFSKRAERGFLVDVHVKSKRPLFHRQYKAYSAGMKSKRTLYDITYHSSHCNWITINGIVVEVQGTSSNSSCCLPKAPLLQHMEHNTGSHQVYKPLDAILPDLFDADSMVYTAESYLRSSTFAV